MPNPFYITTPIYYPNGEPHLGHAYTTTCADIVARCHRLVGDDVFFLTGTDEHGVKMVKTAAERGVEPKALADEMAGQFWRLWQEIDISNDGFIRTSGDMHRAGVQHIVQKLVDSGDIYLGAYEGWYDEGQEEFVSETAAKEKEYKAFNRKPLVRYSEPSYFFRLSKYAPRVLKFIESTPSFIRPESRRNEVLSKLREGVEDLSISRESLKWGVQMPNDPRHVVYVWIDALSNYITGLGYGSGDDARFRKFWPADVHLIGKEIMWFHTVYWPAMLFALGLPMPRQVFAHGWWTSGGQKMSKTLGNFIDLARLRAVIASHGLDALRYYMVRGVPFGNDLDWTDADFAKAFNELANVLGNLLNRVIKMVGNYRGGALPAATDARESIDQALIDRMEALPAALADAYGRLALQECASLPLELARAANGYIDATSPFKLAKDPAAAPRLDTILHLAAQAVHRALLGFLPIMPHKAAEGLAQLNASIGARPWLSCFKEGLPAGHQLGEGKPLFPKQA